MRRCRAWAGSDWTPGRADRQPAGGEEGDIPVINVEQVESEVEGAGVAGKVWRASAPCPRRDAEGARAPRGLDWRAGSRPLRLAGHGRVPLTGPCTVSRSDYSSAAPLQHSRVEEAHLAAVALVAVLVALPSQSVSRNWSVLSFEADVASMRSPRADRSGCTRERRRGAPRASMPPPWASISRQARVEVAQLGPHHGQRVAGGRALAAHEHGLEALARAPEQRCWPRCRDAGASRDPRRRSQAARARGAYGKRRSW